MIDESGRFVEVSSVAEQIIGLPKEELINKNVDEFAPPEISKKAHHILSKSPDNNQYLENIDVFEFDGSKRYFESSLFPINVADNKEKLCVYLGIDVTDRVTAEHALMEIENKYSSYVKSAPFGVFIVNEDGQYVEVNPCACEITGYSEDRLLKMSIRDITAEDSLESAMLHFEQLKRTGRMSAELQYIHDNGLPRWWTIDAVKLSEHRYLGFSGDITQRKAAEANLLYLANHDTLTGLFNRRFYEEELKRADDSGQLPLSIIFADINGLKLINDSYGHTEGDRIIIEAARLLKENCRDDDVLARTGGDDFSIILPGTDIQSARGVFGAIQDACERYNASISNQAYHINLSLGYDTKETMNDDITQICKRAEDNMNQRKLLEKYSSYSAIISSIRATMMEKSHETEEHAERIAQLTRRLGLHLNLSVIELDHLELLATLHDIGKVGIAENILNKQDKLDEDEWNEKKKHPEIGYRIAMSSPSLAPIAKYILHHHERWDGHGYPHNLKELDIPLLSRILSIADAYDAMTQDRIYRKAITHQEAIEEIRRCSGTQFDPHIAQVFISTVMGK